MKQSLGIISCGHQQVAQTAKEILLEGGNAFDAIVAAFFTSCVAEPVLASLAGGGYLLAHQANQKPIIYDFFVQTPLHKKPSEAIDFYATSVDFGVVKQEFHIGTGSIATPGAVAGMFAIHRDLCTLPIKRLVEPAIRLAKKGVVFNPFQAYLFQLIHPIFTASDEVKNTFASAKNPQKLAQKGDKVIQNELAESLATLAKEGEKCFYHGDLAKKLVDFCAQNGGHLTHQDLKNYQVYRTKALKINYRNTVVYTNPPPSSGGILIAFALKLLESFDFSQIDWHSAEHLALLAEVMALTNKARVEKSLDHNQLLDKKLLNTYRQEILHRSSFLRGTTHFNVMDNQGNSAAMTVSNGEGSGYFLPNSGIMLNNMLGEQDLNPDGFHHWKTNQRMTSMMAPCFINDLHSKKQIILGSGGSNRLRTAILQVIHNLIDFDFSVDQAVNQPRIHFENDLLNTEKLNAKVLKKLKSQFPKQKNWADLNMFFGGAHTLIKDSGGFSGAGDLRRSGVCEKVVL